MPPVKTFGERIADALVEDGLLSAKQVEELLEKQKKEGTRLIKLVIEKAYVTDQDMVVCMGRVLNTSPINLTKIGVSSEVAELVPKDVATNHKVFPVSRLGNKLFLAMADPLNVLAIDDVKRITKLEVSPLIASEKSILDKINNQDGSKGGATMEAIIQDAQKQADAEAEADNLEVTKVAVEETNLDHLAASTEEAPVIKLANLILVQAIKDRASDIHIEPFEKQVRLRYRVDGALMDMPPPPKNLQVALSSRLKIMSSLDIAERRLPQDGRMRVKVAGRDIDLRVSFLPTVHGEKCVLRVLDKSNLSASMDKLGMDPDTFRRFKSAVDSPHGLILVTGPTGSGKTTTLYSALNELNNPEYNIITVEDPVEFQIPGINQVPVKKEIGLTFAAALRSILRQDPDIIMIGEIRDTETAEIAVEAALTGHQVLSTMHCNDAPGAISRLDDMEIAPFLISSSVILACAQRLMRRICPACKEPVTYPAKIWIDLGVNPKDFDGVTLFKGRGCDRCKNTGYAGRAAIIEVMTMTDDLRKMVIKRSSASEVGKVAVEQGMRTLRMVALDKVREGISTLEQVLVVTAAH
ncbi:MAG: type pilus assembly ATPase PilB [Verrucomicrobiales bacterium]|jgi:type IV pilus assembly protein PilB|nr:type pilus assembly ATPase PilB [Verrucomicrobiales bacterium]MDB6130745.1 type pilus assembly ATPase PilB [Verrucomicrobiales bacterium]